MVWQVSAQVMTPLDWNPECCQGQVFVWILGQGITGLLLAGDSSSSLLLL